MKIQLKAFTFTALILFFTNVYGAGLSELSRGESLFKENNAKDAVQVLEYEIMNGQISDNTYNFLGLGYYQLGEYDKSLDAFRRGLKVQPDNAKILSYNMGNTYYALKDYTSAITCYSDSLKADPLFYDALLNRANALLMAGQLVSAKDDYVDFIAKCPDNPQRERIELLIQALEEEIARREEEARLLAEQNKAKWEEYDGNLSEKKNEAFSPYWEEVENSLAEKKKNPDAPEWEKIHGEEPDEIFDDAQPLETWEEFENESERGLAIKEDKSDSDAHGEHWEEFESDGENGFAAQSEVPAEQINDEENWLTFSDEELDEMKLLEAQSREEHEKWVEEVRQREAEIAKRIAQTKQKQEQQAYEDEKRIREELLEEMRKSEDERRKKLLEDVANSLQGTDSTNLTSGAEDLIEYDLEGELD